MEKAKTTIVILVHNQLHYTKKFIKSLKENTKLPYKLIVVDNGSDKDTRDYLKKQDCKVITNKKNLGVVKGWNQGVKACKTEYVCIMNNDIVVAPNWLTPMQKALEREEGMKCVQPVTSGGDIPQNFPNNFYPKPYIEKTERIFGWCFMLPMAVFDEIGMFDEQFDMAWWEDRDFGLRLCEKNYHPHIVHASYIHHYQNRTLWTIDGIEKKMAENQIKFVKKWGQKAKEILGEETVDDVIDLEVSIRETHKKLKEEILNKDK
jgi:GT2 family glycosyltransferase